MSLDLSAFCPPFLVLEVRRVRMAIYCIILFSPSVRDGGVIIINIFVKVS